jgi:hypothetical protein
MSVIEFLIGCEAHGVRKVRRAEGTFGQKVMVFEPQPLSGEAQRWIRKHGSREVLELLYSLCKPVRNPGHMTVIHSA